VAAAFSAFPQRKRARLEALKAQQIRITEILGILEKFNGMTFVNIEPDVVHTGANLSIAPADTSTVGATYSLGLGDLFVLTLSSAQISFIEQAYAALRQSVYDGLLLQTRLKPYMDAVNLTITEAGIGLDFTGTTTLFQTRYDQAPGEALRDLLDLQRIAGTNLNGSGWKGYEQLRGWLADAVNSTDTALSAKLIAALTEFGYSDLRPQGDGATANDMVIGAETGAVLNGDKGNDLILGGAGDDVLNGGTGTDTLYGGMGNDTYVFNLGDGTDTIIEMNGDTGTDTLQFGDGIRAGDLDIFMDGDKLVFAHINGKDRLSVANWFGSLVDGAHRLDTVTFADGAVLQLDALQLGSGGNDTLIGTSNSDILMGGAGDDILISDGNDWLNGGSGADTMAGSIGDDIYVVDNPGDIVIELEGEGNDTIDARISYTLGGNVENMRLMGASSINGTGNELDNVITGNAADNLLSGMDGSDTLIGNAGNDTLDGGLGADIMMGGTGNDVYIVDTLADTVTEQAGQGIDTVKTDLGYTLGSNLENLILTGINAVDGTGNELDNLLTGNAADNTLSGLAGNDTLDGGLGVDTLLGGKGDDIYIVDSTGDLVDENAGEGIDTVKSSITYTLTDHVENLMLTGTAAIDGTGNLLDNIIIGNSGSNLLTGLEGNDTLDGKGGADTLFGGIGNDTYVVDNIGDVVLENADEGIDTVQSSIGYSLGAHLENLTLIGGSAIDGTGNELDNILIGNGAANILDGGLGADAMSGGHGNDTYILDDLGDNVTEYEGQGTDTVVSPFDYTLGANVDNLVLTEGAALNGTGNGLDNVLTGNSNDNTLIGLGGNDTLDGGLGADTLIGGLGDDTYIVDNPLDTTLEAAGEGIDTVKSNLTWVLGDNLDNLTLTGVAAVDGTGNALDNVILGNASDNTLIGLEGNDTLDGGAGADVMLSGTGNDIYVVDNAGDEVVEYLDEGRDFVKSSISYTLTDNVENLTLTGTADLDGTGNGLDNVILGNSGNNILMGLEGNDTLDGGKGADTLLGGLGDDLYIVDNAGDAVIENVGEGIDHVQSGITYTLTDNVENLTLTGTAAINGSGNALDNVILGASGNNVLSGLDGNDTLTGNAVNDTLDGGAGADSMAGGAGNDTYIVDNVGDSVTEALNAGTDTVQSSISYTLGVNVENLSLTGIDAINGTGNTLNNTITGNAAANVLDGGAGADTMVGGAGDDIYVVDNTGDVVTEVLNAGIDTVKSSITYTLTANVENLTLTDIANIDGTGNALDNTIIGNSAANVLNGGQGADTMQGGAGSDTYIVDSIGDIVIEGVDAGTDTVRSSVTYMLSDNVENLTLTGTAAINGTGNALDNIITGNGGVNILAGQGGNDTYYIDNTADVIVENTGEGTDSVFAAATYTLSENVEYLTLTGTAAINATGNALDNIITGNSGANVLDGGVGADIMAGGAGDDMYIVDNAGDVVIETLNAGTDTVQSSISYTLTDNLENLVLTGVDAINATGNALDNAITGNAGHNLINGGAGADTMAGGAGNDTLLGGTGNDRYVFNPGDGVDIIIDALGSDTLYIGGNLIEANLEGLRDGDNMIVSLFGTSETVTLTHWFVQSEGVNRIEFSDGSSLDRAGIEGLLNRPPVANPDAITVFEDGGVLNMSTSALLANDIDPNVNDIISVVAVGASAIGASVSLTNGQVQYDIGERFQELGAGQTVMDSFGYTISDNKGETASSVVNVTITGINDAPVTAVDTVTAQEDLIVAATGNVLSNDTDIDQGTVLSVVDAGFRAGNYGNLALGADGSYAYTVDNTSTMVQSLGRTAQLSEHFGYTVTDGIVGVASALDVYLNGTNDAPILVAPLADQDITFNKSFSWQLPSGSFIDIDQGDALDYSATLADGSPLPDWLSFDPINRTFSGMAPKTVGYVDIQVTATDRVAATGSIIDSLAASDIFRISISHGNEGVGNGQDSAPAGTDSNFNDGPGTSPGNPGAGGGYSAGNILLGTEGNDNLTGSSGDDLFDGSGGNDRLEGGAGNDIYLFGRNGGVDTVIEKDATAGNNDVLRFGDNIASEQAWFRRVGSDLEVSFIGTDDRAIVNNWYKGSAYHLEQFQTADGKMLLDSQVENLVSAMAAFSPPAAGQTTLPQNYQDALAPVLAANWK
jgi:VCBS repeat-containing protein